MGERGLKLFGADTRFLFLLVAPYGGAWIETKHCPHIAFQAPVAPYGGAWIETMILLAQSINSSVAPYGGAWIETHVGKRNACGNAVAPYGGAWIETLLLGRIKGNGNSRSLWGSVD